MYCVYKITNNINRKTYIGVTDNYDRRMNDHIMRSKNKGNKEYNKTLYRAFRKYGINNFTFEIVEDNIPKDAIFNKEIYYIKTYNSKDNGYNETYGGENPPIVSKLNEKDILDIRIRCFNMESSNNVYNDYKDRVGKRAFNEIFYGRSWTKIGKEYINSDIYNQHKINGYTKGLINANKNKVDKPSKKLNIEDVKEIKNLHKNGFGVNEIYMIYKEKGLIRSYNTINNIIKGKSWR